MTNLVTINHPFQTVDDFHQRAGRRLGTLIHRLAGKYPQLQKGCGARRVLLALSVAWALTGLAKEGNLAAFEHIDEALSPPYNSCGCVMTPQWGCVMVEGTPFYIEDGEQQVLHFLWDGFTIFIDQEGTDKVGQSFFDFADTRQTSAYIAMGEAELLIASEAESEARIDETAPKAVETDAKAHEDAAKTNLMATTGAAIETCPIITDTLADFVDTAMEMGLANAEQTSVTLDRYCVEASGEAQRLAIEQARRLHYLINRNKLTKQYNHITQKGTIIMGDTYHIQGDFVKGDKVMGNKYVGAACQQGEADEHLKNALETLMEEKGEDGKPLFQTQAQWFAVYRILTDEYGWKDGALAEFCRRINQLGLQLDIACKLDGIKKVNQMAPFYKAFSEWEPQGNVTAYRRQESVARRFQELMREA